MSYFHIFLNQLGAAYEPTLSCVFSSSIIRILWKKCNLQIQTSFKKCDFVVKLPKRKCDFVFLLGDCNNMED